MFLYITRGRDIIGEEMRYFFFFFLAKEEMPDIDSRAREENLLNAFSTFATETRDEE